MSIALASTGLSAIGSGSVLVRLAVAAGLGALIGFERELHERDAGTRTHALVALGSCLFTVVGAYGFRELVHASTDPTRVAAQVVTGIGFLGGGVILRQGLTVRGLTTAGSLWMSAAIGLSCAAGAYWAALIATGLTLFALAPLRFVSRRLARNGSGGRLTIELVKGQDVRPLLDVLGEVRTVEICDERDRRLVVAETARSRDASLLARLAELENVRAVRSD
jgi:uncharacterized membrane protein YhiD involved in acid resistance